MKHLYFIRHGLSEMNVRKQRSGRTDTLLHPVGHDQAKAAGKKARDEGLVFDIILASPLKRAHVTAQHVATEVGYDLSEIIVDDRLLERNFGVLEGHADTPEIQEGIKQGEHFIDKYENVETLTDLQARADGFLEYLHSLDHDTILIVSHGAFGRALYRSVNELPISDTVTRYNNAELTRLI